MTRTGPDDEVVVPLRLRRNVVGAVEVVDKDTLDRIWPTGRGPGHWVVYDSTAEVDGLVCLVLRWCKVAT